MFVCGKTTFLCRDKNHTLTYQRLTNFVASFAYLGFLDTRLSLGPSFFPIPLALRYKVTSRSGFYQTWFLAFWVFIYFVGVCLIMWSRCPFQLVSKLGSKIRLYPLFFLLVSACLALVVFYLVSNNFVCHAWTRGVRELLESSPSYLLQGR